MTKVPVTNTTTQLKNSLHAMIQRIKDDETAEGLDLKLGSIELLESLSMFEDSRKLYETLSMPAATPAQSKGPRL